MAAEPFDCSLCQRRIGKNRTHFVVGAEPKVVCINCMENRHSHAVLYPGCQETWHDTFDHGLMVATRGGARRIIGEAVTA
jgi:predicted amidophosphoribosyltransferase